MPHIHAARPVLLTLAVGLLLLTPLAAAGCSATDEAKATGSLKVVATATFLADIAQHVAGDRFTVESLVPCDADLHACEPTTRDLTRVNKADLFILNGGGLEGTLENTLRNAAPDTTFVVASAGLGSRTPQPDEPLGEGESDPHYWLDPTLVIRYAETIRDAFSRADPQGANDYAANTEEYIAELKGLDTWIAEQVATLPAERRLLVMNHVSHGYYADRYGFRIVGAVVPSVATGESPTAQQLTKLTTVIRDENVRAIFVELGENPQLADQIAAETGVAVVDDLRDHSLSPSGGEAPTYIEMMKYDTRRIVAALQQ